MFGIDLEGIPELCEMAQELDLLPFIGVLFRFIVDWDGTIRKPTKRPSSLPSKLCKVLMSVKTNPRLLAPSKSVGCWTFAGDFPDGMDWKVTTLNFLELWITQ
jgi:hypothetical protein